VHPTAWLQVCATRKPCGSLRARPIQSPRRDQEHSLDLAGNGRGGLGTGAGGLDPFIPLIERVPRASWQSIHAAVLAAIGRYVEGDSVKFGAVVVFATGTKGEGAASQL
jgi:hypothetical protein